MQSKITMAVSFSSRGVGGATEKWIHRDNSETGRRVSVVYYLSRNGHLDQPHFMELPLSSPHGLFLSDVIERLNLVRGKGMGSMYSWSSKRSYKNSFVWHDLAENDFIYPSHGQEYVLKGSELLDSSINLKPLEAPPSKSQASPETLVTRRRNQSWVAVDLHEYKVYKTESTGESTQLSAADASTQTDDRRRQRNALNEDEEEPHETYGRHSTEEISPPPSDSSPETLEALMKADGRLILCAGGGNEEDLHPTAENYPNGRMKASSVLKQLLSCGSMSFKNCGPTYVKDKGLSLVGRVPGKCERFSRVKSEDKEYFSGSFIETRKEALPGLKRSSSYNADR